MKTLCLNFRIHMPVMLKRYRFLHIGNDHHYYDDYCNETYTRHIAESLCLPANNILLDLFSQYAGQLKVSFSVSGIAFEQFEQYAPEVLHSFRQLADTGCAEFICGSFSHSLASRVSSHEFTKQVNMHRNAILNYTGIPAGNVFSDMLFCNDIGKTISQMGFNGALTEGAQHILGWKSPNCVYSSALSPDLKILFRNHKLGDDIRAGLSSSDYPLTPEKLVYWIGLLDPRQQFVNICLDFSDFCGKQSSGVLEFIRLLPKAAFRKKFSFAVPSELLRTRPVAPISIHHPVMLCDRYTCSLNNEMQSEALNRLYQLSGLVEQVSDLNLKKDWKYLQASDHFRIMGMQERNRTNPHGSAYGAFINYMNILTDFTFRLKGYIPAERSEIARLLPSVISPQTQSRNMVTS